MRVNRHVENLLRRVTLLKCCEYGSEGKCDVVGIDKEWILRVVYSTLSIWDGWKRGVDDFRLTRYDMLVLHRVLGKVLYVVPIWLYVSRDSRIMQGRRELGSAMVDLQREIGEVLDGIE